MTDVTALLSKNAADIKESQQPPTGTYIFRVMKWEIPEKKSMAGNSQVYVNVKAVAAQDVDPAAVQSFTESGGNMEEIEMMLFFTVTEKALFRLNNFLTHCGIPLEGTVSERLAQVDGKLFRGSVIQKPGQKDPKKLFAQIDETAPYEG